MQKGLHQRQAKRARRMRTQRPFVRRLGMEPLESRTVLSAANLAVLIGVPEVIPTDSLPAATRLAPRPDGLAHSVRASVVEAASRPDVRSAPASKPEHESFRELLLVPPVHAAVPSVGQQHLSDKLWQDSLGVLPATGQSPQASPLDLRLLRAEFDHGTLTRNLKSHTPPEAFWFGGRPTQLTDATTPGSPMRPTSMLVLSPVPIGLTADWLAPGVSAGSPLEPELLTTRHDISLASAGSQGNRISSSLVDLNAPAHSAFLAYPVPQFTTIRTSLEDAEELVQLSRSNRFALTGTEGGYVELGNIRDLSPLATGTGSDRGDEGPTAGSRTRDLHESRQPATEHRGRMLRWLRLAPATLEHGPADDRPAAQSGRAGTVFDRDEGGMIVLVAAASCSDDPGELETSATRLLVGSGSAIPDRHAEQIQLDLAVGMFLDFELATAPSTNVGSSDATSQQEPAGKSTADRSEPLSGPDEVTGDQTAAVTMRPQLECTVTFSAIFAGACLLATPRRPRCRSRDASQEAIPLPEPASEG